MTAIIGLLEYLPKLLILFGAMILAYCETTGWGWFFIVGFFFPPINLRERVVTTYVCSECESNRNNGCDCDCSCCGGS